MARTQRTLAFRCLLMGGAALLLIAGVFATPVFLHGRAAAIPFGSDGFASQWNAVEPHVPNFWGPANLPALQEPYTDAPSGSRLVQYFDKARMEQTTPTGAVTNGLLTVELVTGRRQFGDTTFTAFPPARIAIVGDPTNTFPTYASLNTSALPATAAQNKEPDGIVFTADGTLGTNSQLAADPGAAFGSYQSDPGGKYAHNIPQAFWTYLTGLPVPWQTAMGYPLTEAVWVQVLLNNNQTWVMMQPYERRVLSYTPTNPVGFQVEMGNIGKHYLQWRYVSNPGGVNGPPTATPLPTTTAACAPPGTTATPGTPSSATSTPTLPPCSTPDPCATATALAATATAAVSPTPCDAYSQTATAQAATASVQGVEFRNFRASVTDTTFSFSFTTNIPATSYIRYGTASGSYTTSLDIATSQTTSHSLTITGLTPGQTYYFIIRISSSVDSINRDEDYFQTTNSGAAAATSVAQTAAAQTAATQTAAASKLVIPPPGSPPQIVAPPGGSLPVAPGNGGCPVPIVFPPATAAAYTAIAAVTNTAIAKLPAATQAAIASQTAAAASCHR